MATLRRNAGWLSVVSVLLCALAAAWWLTLGRPSALAGENYTALDEVTAARLDALRREQGLDGDVLASLNLNDASLETVLAAARGWYEANAQTLRGHWAALADQRALIRRYRAEITQGLDRAAELASARQRLAQLEADYATLVAGFRQTARASLSDGQRALADHLRVRRELVMPFRALELTAEQDQSWQAAGARYHQRLAVLRDAAERATVQTAYQQELQSALGAGAVQDLAALRAYLGPASTRVVAAVHKVLPVTAEG